MAELIPPITSVSCLDGVRVAINAANLHVGGGVQVAVALLTELARLPDVACKFEVLVSTEVDRNLAETGVSHDVFCGYSVCDAYGISQLWSGFNRILNRYEVVLTVFGPLYVFRRRFISIVGFAQAWIAYPRNEAFGIFGPVERVRERVKFAIQAWFHRRADRLIVELPHVRDRLLELGWRNAITVVPNCVSSIYQSPAFWRPVPIPRTHGLKLGIISRDYPHKNLGILPMVKDILQHKYVLQADFLVTLTTDEWRARSEDFRSKMINVGALSIAQCPMFYEQIDGVIFPSLLECFSATPIEALTMGLPLFASDRGFVRDVCGDAANYFDPMNPESIAESIAAHFSGLLQEKRSSAPAGEYADPSDRARQYVAILREVIGGLPSPAS